MVNITCPDTCCAEQECEEFIEDCTLIVPAGLNNFFIGVGCLVGLTVVVPLAILMINLFVGKKFSLLDS